jgi:hypothetical protein
MCPRSTTPRFDRERPISWAVIEWLEARGWPIIFTEVQIPRGLVRGRVDVAAASRGFRTSVVVEVKAVYRPGDPEGQLFDAGRVAEHVYVAAPPEVLGSLEAPAGAGILEARTDGSRTHLVLTSEAARGSPEPTPRKEFLHALMRSALRTGRFDSSWVEDTVCPACMSGHCPLWVSHRVGEISFQENATDD